MTNAEAVTPMVEMNTTPLIDVMLVLLVMFIITIPAQTHAVKLDLPAGSPAVVPLPTRNLIEVTAAGAILWNGTPVAEPALRGALGMTQQMRPLPELHLRPAPDARYEIVDRVLAIIKQERVQKFGFVGNERYAIR